MRRTDKRLPAPTFDEPLELAYLAGFLDGEGCINITTQKSRGKLNYRMQIVIWNTNQPIIESLAAHWAGGFHIGIKTRTNATENPRPCCMAWWHGELADELLARLEPYVRVKHAQLLNAREFQALKRRRIGTTSPALLKEMARLHEIGRLLNLHETPPAAVKEVLGNEPLQLEILDLGKTALKDAYGSD